MAQREEPLRFPAKAPPSNPAHSAAFIFVHGYGDDAVGLEGIPRQFQAANKLPYMQWVLPNALEHRDAMERAWYTPSPLSPFPSQRPELDDPEDEDGMMVSLKYLGSLVDDLVDNQGIPANRIVFGGFSQGCALTLLLGTASKYSGKLAGLAGICGYMPLVDRISEIRDENVPDKDVGQVPIFLVRGVNDMLVPKRYFRIAQEKLVELGVKDGTIEAHEYAGMGHSLQPQVLRDLAIWLEKVVPPIEAS